MITFVYSDNQGEWEGNALDLVLAAMQSFPNAAFLGLTFFATHSVGPTVLQLLFRYWFKHRKLLSGSRWHASHPPGR